MTQVGMIYCDNYNQLKDKIEKLFSLHGGIESYIQRGDKVLLKPNLLAPPKNSDEPVTTDGRMILAVVELLNDFGVQVILGDSPAFSNVKGILAKIGIDKRLSDLGVKVVEFNRPINRFQKHTYDAAVLECDKMINLPKVKVHSQVLITLSVKNLFGCVTGKRKPLLHLAHGDRSNHFAEMLVRNYTELRPAFTLVDAVDVMEKNGPRGGVRKKMGLLFSGVDCVAIDRVITEVLDIPFEQNRVLKAAKALDVGEWRLNKIELLGEKVLPKVSLVFPNKLPINFSPIRVIISILKNMIIKRRKQVRK